MKNKMLLTVFLVMAIGLTTWAANQEQSAKTAIDPVCKMTVTKDGAKWTYDDKGTTYYFCSEGCKTKFAKEPEKYLAELAVEVKEGGMQAHAGMMGGHMQGHMQDQRQGQMQEPMGMMPRMARGMRMPRMPRMMHGRMGMMGGMGPRMSMRMPMRPGMPGMMHGMMGGMAGFGPMMMAGVVKKVENTKDGVVVTLSSKDPETVKMIQEHLAQLLEQEKMMSERRAKMKEAQAQAEAKKK